MHGQHGGGGDPRGKPSAFMHGDMDSEKMQMMMQMRQQNPYYRGGGRMGSDKEIMEMFQRMQVDGHPGHAGMQPHYSQHGSAHPRYAPAGHYNMGPGGQRYEGAGNGHYYNGHPDAEAGSMDQSYAENHLIPEDLI